jgi:CBS domain-containing protein
MARYGRDFDRDRWGMQGDEGQGGGSGFYGGGDRLGNHWRGGQGGGQGGYGADYGGMGSDSQGYPGWSGGYRGGQSGFGSGGGSYDNDFGSGGWRGGEGVNWSHGGRLNRGQGGDYYSSGGYGYETGGYGGLRDYGTGSGGGYGGGSGGYESGMGSDWGARGGAGQDETRRMRAVDIMTENPECVTPESSLADAAMKMRDLDVGIIPVVDSEQGRRLKGVVTDRDITIRAVAEGMDARSTKVQEVMTTEVESCNKNDTVADILRVMEREQVRRVPITDREGRLVGIVAQADVVRDLDSERGEHRVNDAIEHISEPARGGGMGRGSQSRAYGRSGGGMSAGTRRTGAEGGASEAGSGGLGGNL